MDSGSFLIGVFMSFVLSPYMGTINTYFKPCVFDLSRGNARTARTRILRGVARDFPQEKGAISPGDCGTHGAVVPTGDHE
jgi:hypothetical protein